MSAPFVIAVPAKGRLQANMEALFARAGLELVKPRGVRDYRGTIANLVGVEVAYLSAAEVVDLLAQGVVHLGITGEDLVREKIPDADEHVVLVDGLGFGHLQKAMQRGYLPNLRRLIDRGEYRVYRWRCGLAADTPPIQSGLMYGRRDGIVGFYWWDRAEQRRIAAAVRRVLAYR